MDDMMRCNNNKSGWRWPLAAAALATAFAAPAPAAADFTVCNRTDSRVGLAIGYHDTSDWTTEGWWNLGAGECRTILEGELIARYYYLHAVDYDIGGVWSGPSSMCIDSARFKIYGPGDCAGRGFETAGFVEVDTGEYRNWTHNLADLGQQGAGEPKEQP